MSVEEKVRQENLALQELIRDELLKIQSGESRRNIRQIQLIEKELQNAEDTKGIPFMFPHMIVDSWSFKDELGIRLMDYAALYRRWK